MKKWLIGILVALLIVSLGVGTFFGVKAIKEKKSTDTVSEISLLEDKYTQGDNILFKILVNSEKEFVSLSYQFNNESEVPVKNAIKGENSEEDTKHKLNDAKYFIDSGVQIIDSSDLAVGSYILTVYAYDEYGTRFVVNQENVIFKIVPSPASAS